MARPATAAVRPTTEQGAPTPSRRSRSWKPIAFLAAAYALSRIAWAAVGVRFDDSVLTGTRLTDKWQLLDVSVLRHDLVEGVWHLNMQPPLLNLFAGGILTLPAGGRRPVEVVCALALGLVIVLATYLLLVELRVPVGVSVAVTLIGVVASPAYLLYENWFDDAYPTAALTMVAAWCLARFLRTRHAAVGAGFFVATAAIFLLNSTYQWVWLLGSVVIVLVTLPREWRRVLVIAAVPLLVVAAWWVKDLALFGTSTTSSWLGMNLARDVLFRAPPGRVAELQQRGVLSPLASIPAFSDPHVYAPRFARLRPDPDPALGAVHKGNGAPNFNNPVYVPVSNRYLGDDLAYIRADPARYAADVGDSVQIWLVATDQNFTNSVNWPLVRTYAEVFDRAVEWQPIQDPAPGLIVFRPTWHRPLWLSWQAIVVTVLAVLVAPVLAWRRRRTDRAFAGTIAVLWWTTAYAFATTSLLEIGENERFRFGLGPLPLVLAVVVVTEGVRARSARRAERRASAAPIQEASPER